MHPTIHCILLDMDNTLVDIPNTHEYFDGLIKRVIKDDFNLPLPPVEERDRLWRTGDNFIDILKSWGLAQPNQFWELFDKRDSLGRKKMIEEKRMKIYPDVIPFLQKMRKQGIPMAVVSNTPTFIVEPELRKLNLQKYFDLIVGLGDNQEQSKPNPEGILKVLDKMGFEPSQTIFGGDSVVDAIAGVRAGVHTVIVNRKQENFTLPAEIDSNQVQFFDSLSKIAHFYHLLGIKEIQGNLKSNN